MRESLALGNLLLAPERMFPVDGDPTPGWWEIDRETGVLVAVAEDGQHKGLVEYALQNINVNMVVGGVGYYVVGMINGLIAGRIAYWNARDGRHGEEVVSSSRKERQEEPTSCRNEPRMDANGRECL